MCSDLPFIDTKILEIPNPNHPYGIRGVGETSIVPPLGAVGNAIANAVGLRLNHAPMSPVRVLDATMRPRGRKACGLTCMAARMAADGRLGRHRGGEHS